MQHPHNHQRTPAELKELCAFINKLHRIVWTVLALALAIGAIFHNPAHLVTAALVFLFSRAEWEPSDIKALE